MGMLKFIHLPHMAAALAFFFSSTTTTKTKTTTTTKTIAVRPDTDDYRALLVGDAPMMDVRAPVEFAKGAFPSSQNFPLMTDNERAQVGTCYKEHGQSAAVELGSRLVKGRVKSARVGQWAEFATANKNNGYLYCFRGGLRSRIVQQWLEEEAGIHYPIVKGGYKAMRRYLLDELDRSLDTKRTDVLVIAGKTGTGKTRVIQQLNGRSSVDLEGLAHHRGSTFGQMPEDPEQPSQINFENAISIALLKILTPAADKPGQIPRVFVEDESVRIGRLHLPTVLWDRMRTCNKLVMVEESMEGRVGIIYEDYVSDLGRRFVALHGEELGSELHRDSLLGGLERLRKRLGGYRYLQLKATMEAAFAGRETKGDTTLHRAWIQALLEQYYDPMYEYHQEQRRGEVLFRGNRGEVLNWARSQRDDTPLC